MTTADVDPAKLGNAEGEYHSVQIDPIDEHRFQLVLIPRAEGGS